MDRIGRGHAAMDPAREGGASLRAEQGVTSERLWQAIRAAPLDVIFRRLSSLQCDPRTKCKWRPRAIFC